MLLPLSRRAVDKMSLANHLALSVCRSGAGNVALLNDLVSVVYLTYYIQQEGLGDVPPDLYRRAERDLEQLVTDVNDGTSWRLDEEVASVVEKILATHDQQLASIPKWILMTSKDRLNRAVANVQRSRILVADSERQGVAELQ